MKNVSSSNARASRSGARSFSGGRKTVAGMTAVSLALAGLTVPAVVDNGSASGPLQAYAQDREETGYRGLLDYNPKDGAFRFILSNDSGFATSGYLKEVDFTFNDVSSSAKGRFTSTESIPVIATYIHGGERETVTGTMAPKESGDGVIIELDDLNLGAEYSSRDAQVRITGTADTVLGPRLQNINGFVTNTISTTKSVSFDGRVEYRDESDEFAGNAFGVEAELLDEKGQVVDSATTGADGTFTLKAPAGSNYRVRILPPEGFMPPSDATWNSGDGDVDATGAPFKLRPIPPSSEPPAPVTSELPTETETVYVRPEPVVVVTTLKPEVITVTDTPAPTVTTTTLPQAVVTSTQTPAPKTTTVQGSQAVVTSTVTLPPATTTQTVKPNPVITTVKGEREVITSTVSPSPITTTVELSTPVTTVVKAPTTTVTADPTTVTPTVTATGKPTNTAEPTTTQGDYSDTVTGKVIIKDGNGNVIPSEDADGNPGPIHDTTVIVRRTDGSGINGESTKIVVPVDPETGEFKQKLPEGEYIVEPVVPEGFAKPKPERVEVKPGTKPTVPSFEVKPTERPLKDNSYREVGGTVSGYLVDEKNYPIRDGKVVLVGKNAVNPETGEVFEYEVPVTVDEDGYFITPEIDFKYFPDGEAEFDYEVHLPEGWPTKDKDGNPLKDANGNPLFDQDGKPLRVPAIDKETGSRIVTPDTPLRIPPVNIPAPTDQSIKGSVNDGNGNAVPGTVVVVTDPRGDSHVVETDENGNYEIDKLVPGVHEVEVISPDGERRKDKIVVPIRPGEKVELPEIQITPATLDLKKRVFGRDADYDGYAKDEKGNVIHDANGQPVEDVMTAGVGEELFYTFIITNTSDQDITGIDASSVDDPLLGDNEIQMPEGWTAESVLAPSKSVVFSAKMTAPDAFDFNNVATVKGKTKDGKPVGSNADGAYTKFMALEAEKKVNARFATNPDKPVSVAADEALNFSYEIVNTGSAPMVNVKVTDTVYEGNEADFKDAEGNLIVDPEKLGKGTPLKVKAPDGFNGTLLPGQRVVFTAELPKGLKPGRRHFNAAEARGELPKRPARGREFEGEPDYGEDPSSVLIISPRSNLKGNAHIVVSEGAALANDVSTVLWLDTNGNGKQDPGEGLSGLKVSLVPTDGSPAVSGVTNTDGNILFENAPYGEYTLQVENPGGLRLINPKDPDKNSFAKGSILESKPFNVDEKERIIDLRMESPQTAVTTTVTEQEKIDSSSDLGKCLSTASSVSNPVAWLVPIGLLSAVLGGIGVMFEDELNQASAQANAALQQMMPNVNLSIERPQWMVQAQAEVDRVNRQLAEINPAAPAAAGGLALLAIAGLVTGLYYASCQLGWNEPTAEGAGSSKKGAEEGEAPSTEGAEEKASSSSSEGLFGSSKKAEESGTEETEAAPVVETEAKNSDNADQPAESAN